MSAKNMSSNENSRDYDHFDINQPHDSDEKYTFDHKISSNCIKIKLDDIPTICKKFIIASNEKKYHPKEKA